MAKVKRNTPLEGETWDLSLGAVQHTSRWGTIARAKGSTLRYYPDCPWEKGPKPQPCNCPPPPYEHVRVLYMPYVGPLWDAPYGAALFVGLQPSTGGSFQWTILGQDSFTGPLALSWEFRGVSGSWLMVWWEASGAAGTYSAQNVLPLPGCPRTRIPSGYYTWPWLGTHPKDPWPGPLDTCLFAACYEWYPCGPTSGHLTP